MDLRRRHDMIATQERRRAWVASSSDQRLVHVRWAARRIHRGTTRCLSPIARRYPSTLEPARPPSIERRKGKGGSASPGPADVRTESNVPNPPRPIGYLDSLWTNSGTNSEGHQFSTSKAVGGSCCLDTCEWLFSVICTGAMIIFA